MNPIRDQAGTLIELPLTWGVYLVIVGLTLPRNYHVTVWPLVLLMLLGLAASAFMSLAISPPRFTFLRLPACVWGYALVSAGTLPLMLWAEDHKATFVILGAQVWVAFWIDAVVARALEDRRGGGG